MSTSSARNNEIPSLIEPLLKLLLPPTTIRIHRTTTGRLDGGRSGEVVRSLLSQVNPSVFSKQQGLFLTPLPLCVRTFLIANICGVSEDRQQPVLSIAIDPFGGTELRRASSARRGTGSHRTQRFCDRMVHPRIHPFGSSLGGAVLYELIIVITPRRTIQVRRPRKLNSVSESR